MEKKIFQLYDQQCIYNGNGFFFFFRSHPYSAGTKHFHFSCRAHAITHPAGMQRKIQKHKLVLRRWQIYMRTGRVSWEGGGGGGEAIACPKIKWIAKCYLLCAQKLLFEQNSGSCNYAPPSLMARTPLRQNLGPGTLVEHVRGHFADSVIVVRVKTSVQNLGGRGWWHAQSTVKISRKVGPLWHVDGLNELTFLYGNVFTLPF